MGPAAKVGKEEEKTWADEREKLERWIKRGESKCLKEKL